MQMDNTILTRVVQALVKEGATPYIVGGGFVRDELLGHTSDDVDVEVHGIDETNFIEVLSRFGEVEEVGASFGVYLLEGLDVDFSLPRQEFSSGEGHRDFAVSIDPTMGTEVAARRRDFTINALMQDALTGEVIDHFDGISDLEEGVIRHIDTDTFIEDPLRILRAARFAARFDFEVSPETLELMETMVEQGSLEALPIERVFGEVEKALFTDRPSVFFEILRGVGALQVLFPEIEELARTPQDPIHHPEGDVFIHTMMVLDEAANFRERVVEQNQLGFMLSALFHDIGKPATTVVGNNGRVTAHRHESAGADMIRDLLRNRLTENNRLIDYVEAMTRDHMSPIAFYPNASARAFRRLARRVNIEEIFLLAEADHYGRGGIEPGSFQVYNDFFEEIISEYNLREADQIVPVVTGHDLIERGMTPGPEFGVILEEAFDLQLEGYNRSEILDRVLP